MPRLQKLEPLQTVVRSVLIAVAVAAAGASEALLDNSDAIVGFSIGVAFALVWSSGWWGVLAVFFGAAVGTLAHAHPTTPIALFIDASGILFGALFGSWTKRFLGADRTLKDVRSVLVFAIACVVAGGFFAAGKVVSHAISGVYVELRALEFFTLWGSGITACVWLTPLWFCRESIRLWRRDQCWEFGFIALIALIVSWLTLFHDEAPLMYLPLPIVIWAALRFMQPGAVAISFVVGVVALLGFLRGHTFFVGNPDESELQRVFVQAFILVYVSSGLLVGAIERQRRDARDEVQQTLSLLRKVTSQVPGILFQMRRLRDGRLVFPFITKWAERLTDISIEGLSESGRRLLDRVHPADRDQVARVIAESARNATLLSHEFRLLLPGGAETWCYSEAVPEKEGEEVVWHGFAIDITQRKRVEQALRKNEMENRRLALIAARTVNLVILTDVRRRIEWVNEAFTNVTGYTLEEVRGQMPSHFLQGAETDRGTIAFMRERLDRGEGFKDVEILNYGKNGRKYWLSIEVQPIRDDRGEIVQFMAVEIEITERKRHELDLRRFNEQLEERVELRTRALDQSNKLLMEEVQRRSLAEAQMRETVSQKAVLLKEVHHRVKNNLNMISSLLNLSATYARQSEASGALKAARDRVLTIARVHERFYQNLDASHMDLADFLGQMANDLALLQKSGEIAVDVSAESFLAPMELSIPVGLIVHELLVNAMRHAFPPNWSPSKPVAKRIWLIVHKLGNECEITVRDNGIGLPLGAEDESKGHLGWQLIRALVAQVGGTLEISRSAGTSATVRFS